MPLCPICSQPLVPNPIGRPRVYCGPACRREMEHLRRELPQLEQELAEAEIKADGGFWPGEHRWRTEARRLKLAIDEYHSRIPAGVPR